MKTTKLFNLIILFSVAMTSCNSQVATPESTQAPCPQLQAIQTVTKKDAQLYNCLELGCQSDITIPAGTTIIYLDRPFCAWVHVDYNGHSGYIRATTLDNLPQIESCPPAETPGYKSLPIIIRG